MAKRYKIGVIGFGIAGGAAATLLARQGHSVTVFERAPIVGPVGTGLLLQLSGQVVLHRLGLLEQVVSCSEPLEGLYAHWPNGKALINLRYEEATPGYCGYGVHRGVLFEALRTAAEKEGVTVELDHEINDWRQKAESVIAIGENGAEYGPFDFLIAADGSRSQLRLRLAPRNPVMEYEYGAVWALGKNTQVRGRLHQVISGTDRMLGLLPVGRELCTLFWGVHHDEMPVLRDAGFEVWREEVAAFSPLAEETLASLNGMDSLTFTTYRHASPPKLYNSCIVCLGDAAHSMSPHLGQGANLALLDAAHFADALSENGNFLNAASQYRNTRKSGMDYYSNLSRFLTPFFQSRRFWFAPPRDIALPMMCKVPPLRREMTRSMAGIKQGWVAKNLDYKAGLPAQTAVDVSSGANK